MEKSSHAVLTKTIPSRIILKSNLPRRSLPITNFTTRQIRLLVMLILLGIGVDAVSRLERRMAGPHENGWIVLLIVYQNGFKWRFI